METLGDLPVDTVLDRIGRSLLDLLNHVGILIMYMIGTARMQGARNWTYVVIEDKICTKIPHEFVTLRRSSRNNS